MTAPSRRRQSARRRSWCAIGQVEPRCRERLLPAALRFALPERPASVIGWLVEGLAKRKAAGLAPFTTLSCDNLPAIDAMPRAAACRRWRRYATRRWPSGSRPRPGSPAAWSTASPWPSTTRCASGPPPKPGSKTLADPARAFLPVGDRGRPRPRSRRAGRAGHPDRRRRGLERAKLRLLNGFIRPWPTPGCSRGHHRCATPWPTSRWPPSCAV